MYNHVSCIRINVRRMNFAGAGSANACTRMTIICIVCIGFCVMCYVYDQNISQEEVARVHVQEYTIICIVYIEFCVMYAYVCIMPQAYAH
jgi:hypothetical protein